MRRPLLAALSAALLALAGRPADAATPAYVAPLRAEIAARVAAGGEVPTPDERAQWKALRRAENALAPTNLDTTLGAQLRAASRAYVALRGAFRDELTGVDTAPEANLDDLFATLRDDLAGAVDAEREELEAAIACGTFGRVGFVARAQLDRLARTLERVADQADDGKALALLAPTGRDLERADRSVYLALGGADVTMDVDGVWWSAHGRDPARVVEGAETLLYVAISRRTSRGAERLQLQVWGFDGPGTYPVAATFNSEPLHILTRSADVTGTLTVTDYDEECRSVAGTFELDAIDRANPEAPRQVLIRDGRFTAAVRTGSD
jgi:hypothetical protein